MALFAVLNLILIGVTTLILYKIALYAAVQSRLRRIWRIGEILNGNRDYFTKDQTVHIRIRFLEIPLSLTNEDLRKRIITWADRTLVVPYELISVGFEPAEEAWREK